MHESRSRGDPQRLAKERGLPGIALDEMHLGTRSLGERAAQHDTGKAAAAAEIDPKFGGRRQREELKRIRHVTGPDMRQGRWRDQIGLGLPLHQQFDKAIQARLCFT